MAVSMRFLAKASQSLESIVAHSPKALRTPKTPKTPKTPASPFALSPLTSLTPAVSFFPETVEKVEKCIRKAPARSVHFQDATWVGNATRLLGGRLQPKVETSSPTDLATAASATRDAVLARLARQEDRCVPTPRVAGLEFPDFPMLLGRHVKVPTAQRARSSEAEVEESCAHAARKAFLEQQERRSSRNMVEFVV
eukprot:symbB.v1.2.017437.t1/scaffold1360.1/size203234/8